MNRQLKTSAIKLLAFSAACLAQPSYSEYEFGYSSSVPVGVSSWAMPGTLFPVDSIQGIDINGVFYRYTAVKEAGDPYTVSIQNQDATNGGTIFRATDDWSRGSGGTIQKFVPVPYSSLGDWGEGSINEVGLGRVEDPLILYSYRIDPSRLQSAQETYQAPEVPSYDALSDRHVLAALAPTAPDLYKAEVKEKEPDDEDAEREKRFAVSEDSIKIGLGQAAMLASMNSTQITSYYAASIPGGVYREPIALADSSITDNVRAFSSMSNDRLHTKMVNDQWR